MSQSNLPQRTNPASLLEQIRQAPDLRELHAYLAPLLIRAHNALAQDVRFAEIDDRRKTENILARDLPDSIENYLKMPLDYRNGKKVNEEHTPRELLIKSMNVLVQALKDIEQRNMEVFEKKTVIDHKVFQQKYAVEVEPENEFQSQFDFETYRKNNPQMLERILTKETPTVSVKNEASPKKHYLVAFLNLWGSFSMYRSRSFAQGWPNLEYLRLAHKYRHSNAQKDINMGRQNAFETSEDIIKLRIENIYTKEESYYYLLTLMRDINHKSQKLNVSIPLRKSLAQEKYATGAVKNLAKALKTTLYVMYRHNSVMFRGNGQWDFPRSEGLGSEEAVLAFSRAQNLETIRLNIAQGKWETAPKRIKEFVMDSQPELVKYYLDNLVRKFDINNPAWESALKLTTYYVHQRCHKEYLTDKAINLNNYDVVQSPCSSDFYPFEYMKNLIKQIKNGKINEFLLKKEAIPNFNPITKKYKNESDAKESKKETALNSSEFSPVVNKVIVPKTRII